MTAGTTAGRPVFQRGYVTITRLVTPAEPKAVQTYFQELEDGLARFGRMLAGLPPMVGPARLVAGLGPRAMLEFARLLLMPAQALGEALFADGGARAWLYGSAMHGDVPPAGSGSAIAATYLILLGHGVGWPSPQGGGGQLADLLPEQPRRCDPDSRRGGRDRRQAAAA